MQALWCASTWPGRWRSARDQPAVTLARSCLRALRSVLACWRRRLALFTLDDTARTVVSLLSFAGFAALVAAEQELGPLFALVERAASGGLALGEMVALFWHCLRDRPEGLTRDALGEAVAAGGLAAATPALKVLLGQILGGR